MKIIAFSGMPFSGKSEAVNIAREQNIPVVRMGDMIWDETKKQGFKLTDENVGKIANNMRKQHGKDIWAKRTIEKIHSMKNTNILVIDGIRNREEIETFKKELDQDFIVVAVESSDKKRHMRAMKRGRKDDSLNLSKIKERDIRELSWGLSEVLASADIVISNEESLEEFRKKIRTLFNNKR